MQDKWEKEKGELQAKLHVAQAAAKSSDHQYHQMQNAYKSCRANEQSLQKTADRCDLAEAMAKKTTEELNRLKKEMKEFKGWERERADFEARAVLAEDECKEAQLAMRKAQRAAAAHEREARELRRGGVEVSKKQHVEDRRKLEETMQAKALAEAEKDKFETQVGRLKRAIDSANIAKESSQRQAANDRERLQEMESRINTLKETPPQALMAFDSPKAVSKWKGIASVVSPATHRKGGSKIPAPAYKKPAFGFGSRESSKSVQAQLKEERERNEELLAKLKAEQKRVKELQRQAKNTVEAHEMDEHYEEELVRLLKEKEEQLAAFENKQNVENVTHTLQIGLHSLRGHHDMRSKRRATANWRDSHREFRRKMVQALFLVGRRLKGSLEMTKTRRKHHCFKAMTVHWLLHQKAMATMRKFVMRMRAGEGSLACGRAVQLWKTHMEMYEVLAESLAVDQERTMRYDAQLEEVDKRALEAEEALQAEMMARGEEREHHEELVGELQRLIQKLQEELATLRPEGSGAPALGTLDMQAPATTPHPASQSDPLTPFLARTPSPRRRARCGPPRRRTNTCDARSRSTRRRSRHCTAGSRTAWPRSVGEPTRRQPS